MNNVQAQVVQQLHQIFEDGQFPEIEAVMVGGSVGRGDDDTLSDLDIFLLANEPIIHDKLTNIIKSLASLLGNILLFRGPVYVANFGYSFTVLYDPILVCQFNVNDRNSLRPNPMNSQEGLFVIDRTGYYTDFLARNGQLLVNERQIFADSFTFFWLRALASWKESKRNNLWLAMRHVVEIRDQMIILERLRAKRLPPGLNFNIPSKSIEQDLHSNLDSILSKTICEHSPESVRKAIISCATWYLEESSRYAAQNGIDFASELIAAKKVLERIIT